jgi:hypothetical protein
MNFGPDHIRLWRFLDDLRCGWLLLSVFRYNCTFVALFDAQTLYVSIDRIRS